MSDTFSTDRAWNVAFYSVLIGLLLVVPGLDLAQGEDVPDATRAFEEPPKDNFVGSVDLSSKMMEQYITGENYDDRAGYVIKSAELNGDLWEDIIIGAPGYNNSNGGVFIFFGGTRDRTLTLSEADVIIDGQKSFGMVGLDVGVGDVNGDGMTDLLVSGFMDQEAIYYSFFMDVPEVYLFLGDYVWPESIPTTNADTTFIGTSAYAGFGWEIKMGDITNDGFDDIMITEVETDMWSYATGRIYIWEGSVSLQPYYDVSMGEYDHRIYTSDDEWEYGFGYWGLGSSDLEIGDINGDEYQDILIGSDWINSNGMDSGEVEVVFGSYNLPQEMDLMDYSHLRVTSFAGFDLSYVTSADFDGDGIHDLIVCAPTGFFDHKGGIFVFYGYPLLGAVDISLNDYDFLIRGPKAYWAFGVEGLEDMNYDGRDDLVIFSEMGPAYDYRGCYYIFYSNCTEELLDPIYYMQFETPDFVIKGADQYTAFGYNYLENIAFADINGDGLHELIVSAPMGEAEGAQTNSGIIYLYYQVPSAIQVEDFELLDPDGPDGNILGAGKTYHFYGYAHDTWGLNDFNTFDVSFIMHGGEVEGKSIVLAWDRGLMVMAEKSDVWDNLEIESSAFIPDGKFGLYVYFNLTFHPNFPSEEPMDMVVNIIGGRDLQATLSYSALFKVEPDVEFYGELTVIGEYNDVLAKGSYVRPNEKIEVTGLMAVYQGTMAAPPNSYFKIKMVDNYGNVFMNSSSSGMYIYYTYRTKEMAGREEFNLTFIDLRDNADDQSGIVSFFYIVDTDLPDPPTDIQIRADSDLDDQVGFDNDPQVFITWAPSFDDTSEVIGYLYSTVDGGGTDQGTFVEGNQVVFDGLQLGMNTIYIWSVDNAHNYGPSEGTDVLYDVVAPTFGSQSPTSGTWVNSLVVNYEIAVKDTDGAGVKGSSIEYSISYDAGQSYTAWESTNIRRDGEQLVVKIFLNFREGEDNFVRWRAKDVAGNGYVISEPFQVKVDTVPLSFRGATPAEPVAENYVSCGIIMTDSGSGVDARMIEYSISHNGVSNYGPWERFDLSGSFDSIEISTPEIYFEKGTINYIKWRAKDMAGNGYTYSTDIPIAIQAEKVNHAPVPIIIDPVQNGKYLESAEITFDGRNSIDSDSDELKFLWYSNKDGYLGTDPLISRRLSQDNHLITLHVFDGVANESISVTITVTPDITALDTDQDGIPDFSDLDADNDGLLNIEEDANRDGLINFNETDPYDPDTDKDGVNDRYDPAPRDPTVKEIDDDPMIPFWAPLIIIIAIVLALIVVAVVFILKQRTDRQGMEERRKLRRTRRNIRRFEVLTGVPTNDLPAIEAVQWALPAVISEASEFVLEAPPSDDLLPPGEEAAKEPEAPVKPKLEDMEVQMQPAPTPEAPTSAGPAPPASPEPQAAAPPAGGKVVNCTLCGSEVNVPAGVSSIECPLCGEKINL